MVSCLRRSSQILASALVVNARQDDDADDEPKVKKNVAKSKSATDDDTLEREEEAIKLDGLNVKQIKEMRDKAEKFQFQAEVSRMMKLIINSLYRNKEVGPIQVDAMPNSDLPP